MRRRSVILSQKTLILPPSRLFTVTQEFPPEGFSSFRRQAILTPEGNNENPLSSRPCRLGN